MVTVFLPRIRVALELYFYPEFLTRGTLDLVLIFFAETYRTQASWRVFCHII